MLERVVQHCSNISKLTILVILMLCFPFKICIEKFLFLKSFLVKSPWVMEHFGRMSGEELFK